MDPNGGPVPPDPQLFVFLLTEPADEVQTDAKVLQVLVLHDEDSVVEELPVELRIFNANGNYNISMSGDYA